MSPFIPASPSGTLIIQGCEGVPAQYSLEGIEVTFHGGWCGDSHVDLSARMAGENFVDLAPKVETVADLSLGMLHKARVRVTTREGVHEGVLHNIVTDTSSITFGGAGNRYITDIELGIGNACVPAKTTDLVEVIKEENA